MLYGLLKRIYRYFNVKAVTGVDNTIMPLDQQKKYLKSFDDPKDDYQRSYFKYKCFTEYCYYKKKWHLFFYNFAAMLMYPFIHRMLRKKGISALQESQEVFEAVIENVPNLPNADVIPNEIVCKYKEIKNITEINYAAGFLSDNAEKICQELGKRYFWNFYFRLITMFKLAQFSMYIRRYNPKAIVFYSVEREFAGPLQTCLCEMESVKYISFMHGDYLYALCFAFQRYSMYYTWDEAYNKMFESLRCVSPMKLYKPQKLCGIAKRLDEHECEYFATYYFSAETRECAQKIYDVFNRFAEAGLRCKIRPHPRFSNINMLREIFVDIEIENIQEYSLVSSIEDSWYIVGLNTTVLSQAFFSGKNIVIDDISMVEEYQELRDKGYIMMNRPHQLLSHLVELVDKSVYEHTCKFKIQVSENRT